MPTYRYNAHPRGLGSDSSESPRVSVSDHSVRSADALKPTNQVNPSSSRLNLCRSRAKGQGCFSCAVLDRRQKSAWRVPFHFLNHGLWSERKAMCQTVPQYIVIKTGENVQFGDTTVLPAGESSCGPRAPRAPASRPPSTGQVRRNGFG